MIFITGISKVKSTRRRAKVMLITQTKTWGSFSLKMITMTLTVSNLLGVFKLPVLVLACLSRLKCLKLALTIETIVQNITNVFIDSKVKAFKKEMQQA